MKTVETALGFDRSEVARFRFRCIILYEQQGKAAVKLAFPQVSLRSVYRWRQHYYRTGKQLLALRPQTTKPLNTRKMLIPGEVLSFLKAMRTQHPHLSKYKLKVFLAAWCQDRGLPSRSASWIGKVIARHQLFFSVRRPVRKRRHYSRSGYTIKRTPNPKTVALGYLQLDGITVWWLGKRLVFLTALELKTRKAWVIIARTASSWQARQLLQTVISEITFPLHTIHTDNGSEFKALFDQAVGDLGLTHLWGLPRMPKIQAHIERFNGVIQAEFINYHLDEAVTNRAAFKAKLNQWLVWYNQVRPHHSLGLLSPDQYLVNLQKGGGVSAKCL